MSELQCRMRLIDVEAEKPGRDLFTFECPKCSHLETRAVNTLQSSSRRARFKAKGRVMISPRLAQNSLMRKSSIVIAGIKRASVSNLHFGTRLRTLPSGRESADHASLRRFHLTNRPIDPRQFACLYWNICAEDIVSSEGRASALRHLTIEANDVVGASQEGDSSDTASHIVERSDCLLRDSRQTETTRRPPASAARIRANACEQNWWPF
jgi:hypothetical protein